MAEPRRIFRSRKSKVIAGVCGGLADYFQVDPVLIRLAAIALGVMTGPAAVIGYILAWIVIPEEAQYRPARRTSEGMGGRPTDTSAREGGPGGDGGRVAEDEGKPAEYTPPPDRSFEGPGEAAECCSDVEARPEKERGRVLLGYFLVALGGLLLVQRVFYRLGWWFPRLGMAQFWPIVLIFIGVAILVSGTRRR